MAGGSATAYTAPVSPVTHLLTSWLVAAHGTDNPRDCRWVALAGLAPDADGLGLVWDIASGALAAGEAPLYQKYHHHLLHGLVGGMLLALLAAAVSRRKGRVVLLTLAVFHLHLLCDLLGSRGPDPGDLWPIYYLAPLSNQWLWVWHGQWCLDGWQNKCITVALMLWCLWLPLRLGHSVVGVFNRRADAVFVQVLQGWRTRWLAWRESKGHL